MAVQTYNYELSEVRKLQEMNRQRGSRLLEGTYQSGSDDGSCRPMSFTPKLETLRSHKDEARRTRAREKHDADLQRYDVRCRV